MPIIPDCKNCIEKCPQAKRAHEIGLARMYVTQEFVVLIKKLEAGELTEVIRCKNCGWYRTEDETCGFWSDEGYRDPEHFCGEGKPRE